MAFDYQPFFNKFIRDVLPLDATRVARINSAWSHLEEVVANDSRLPRYKPEIILQGSYAVGTAIAPVRASDEFDVDLVLKLDLPTDYSSSDALSWLKNRLALDEVFKKRITPHPRCVRISYAGDFHMDVVPARRFTTSGPISGAPVRRLKVPDRAGGWRFSNPEGFVRWCNQQDTRTGGDFSRVVMMMKRWRDNGTPSSRRVKSIVFTTLLGQNVPTWAPKNTSTRPDADVLIMTLRNLTSKLAPITGVPVVRNPSLPTENLARSWTRSDFAAFRKELREAYRLAVELRNGGQPLAWRRLFGPSFPAAP